MTVLGLHVYLQFTAGSLNIKKRRPIMMKRYLVFLFCTLFCGIIFFSCDDSGGSQGGPSYYISFKLDGETVFLASEPEAEIYEGTMYLDAEHSPYDEEYISIWLEGTTTGEYPYSDYGCNFIYCADADLCYHAESGSVTVTKIGAVGDTVEGAFNMTTLADPMEGTPARSITDGQFVLPRILSE